MPPRRRQQRVQQKPKPKLRMPNGPQNPIIIQAEQTINPRLAFRGRAKAIRSKPFKDKQLLFQQHQTFEPNTWIVDIVRFQDDETNTAYWYLFFVEANTRYLIVLPANGEWINGDAFQRRTQRIQSSSLPDTFRTFFELNTTISGTRGRGILTRKKVHKIIADSEKAFWTDEMKRFYKQYNISTEAINVARDGHTRLSIMDRTVRTIRGILLSMNDSLERDGEPTIIPNLSCLTQIATQYNNRINRSLGYTPKQIHNNPELERQIVRTTLGENFVRTHNPRYPLEEGSEVEVRKLSSDKGLFRKEDVTTEPKIYKVKQRLYGGIYTLTGSDGSTIRRYRRDIRPNERKNNKL